MNACTFNAVSLEHTQNISVMGLFIELHPVALKKKPILIAFFSIVAYTL